MSNAENKPRVILILQYLMKNTDDLHTVTISDITERLKASGIEANRHTIMRDIQQLQECGFDIICQRSRMNQYSIGERILELPELKLLIDAVEAARFIPQPKSEALIEKLSSLASQYQAKHLSSNIYSNKRVKSDNARVYYSIDLINQAISENKMIRFQYFSYLPTKEKALKFDGMFYRFSPHRITWSNDSYYVIGLNYKYNNEVVYRIDRMTSLEIMDEEAKPIEEGFDMDSFLKSNFLMFDGELTRVTLKCDKGMMNSIIDKFGEDVETFYDAEQDPEHFYAYADAATGPTFYSWVFNYQGKIRIVEPQNIRDEFIEMLQKQLT